MNHIIALLFRVIAEAAWEADAWYGRDPVAFREMCAAAFLAAGLDDGDAS